MQRIVSPSMLSADFGNLGHEIEILDRSAAGMLHLDIMDGVFVPNISFGFPVMNAIRRIATKPLDVHLMIVEPERYVGRFAEAGADIITVHYEAVADLRECLRSIHRAGARAGVSIKPGTDAGVLREYLDEIDLVLVMSVEPGFGGQSYIPSSTEKIRAVRRIVDESGRNILVEVDGGVTAENAAMIYDAGADIVVAGNAVFASDDPAAMVEKILNAR